MIVKKSFFYISLAIIIYSLLYHWANDIQIEQFKSNINGPIILIIGSVHGNEPAGGVAVSQLSDKIKKMGGIKCGKLVLISCPNKLGTALNSRWLCHRIFNCDLNRNFPRIQGETPCEPISLKIAEYVKEADFVLDLHEGWGWANHSQSLGSGLYPGETPECIQLAGEIRDSLNNRIADLSKKWVMAENNHPEFKSLRSYCCLLGIHYILVETTGQNDIQPLRLRVEQHLYIMNFILKKYKVINI